MEFKWIKAGIVLSLLSMLFSFGMGVLFGLVEDRMKGALHQSAIKNLETVYQGDEEKMQQVTAKAWVYFQRAHLHAGVLGIGALAMCLLMGFAGTSKTETIITTVCVGAGALLYGIFWLLAGSAAPALGSTGAAKAAYNWLGMGAPAVYIIGTLLAMKNVIQRKL